MVRDLTSTLWSNDLATPIYAAQNRGLRETYLKSTVSAHYGRHEIKAGMGSRLRFYPRKFRLSDY